MRDEASEPAGEASGDAIRSDRDDVTFEALEYREDDTFAPVRLRMQRGVDEIAPLRHARQRGLVAHAHSRAERFHGLAHVRAVRAHATAALSCP